ncbi:MAG: hypothetical protein OEY43_00580 [Gammaproteobacteria bacterium]|nr:hypothetical protein [Gammaproteobacteria bacterium]
MSDTKQILRVVLKLMAGFALAWLMYVFLSGLMLGPDTGESHQYSFELGSMQPGEVKYMQAGRRKLVVVYGTQYYVAWAIDPVYGCPLEYQQEKQEFKSACVESRFDLQGRVIAGSKTELDLKGPKYRITPGSVLYVDAP